MLMSCLSLLIMSKFCKLQRVHVCAWQLLQSSQGWQESSAVLCTKTVAHCCLQVALLEPADSPLTWPWVSRGKPEDGVNKLQAWDIDVPAKAANNSDLARAIAGMSYSYAGTPSNAFGAAGELPDGCLY